ncbi:hypothetical protein AVEN_11206-1 [Araneus ventricosus]|uniref:Uncharacterized protein n=1 Tax=Araneus ventricosus TaxID=182803 RepID=A0A4Y2ITV5_ARAVE|nr:hypothetical protein AVEN_11206-1 [Araneus ventricosus]
MQAAEVSLWLPFKSAYRLQDFDRKSETLKEMSSLFRCVRLLGTITSILAAHRNAAACMQNSDITPMFVIQNDPISIAKCTRSRRAIRVLFTITEKFLFD